MNNHDMTNPIQQRVAEIRREAEAESDSKTPGANWRAIVLADLRFELIGEVTLRAEHLVDRAGLLGRVRSSSPFARLPVARQQELLAGLEALVEGDVVDLSPLTQVMALRRLPSPRAG